MCDSHVCKSGSDQEQAVLEQVLLQRIRDRGPIPFSEFMRAALYHPELGYYTSGRSPWGPDGDYVTAPQVHPALGIGVALTAIELDAALASPAPFTLTEVGGGDGRLLAAAVGAIRERRPELWRRLRVVSVEAGGRARERQRERLAEPPGGLTLGESLASVEGDAVGLVYSNELLDAFPVERLTLRAGRLLQSAVGEEEGRLVERFATPADEAVRRHLDANGIRLREGQVAEVCLEVASWIDAVSERLRAGGLLTIDYGHETATLYGESRPLGTLVCQRRFQLGDAPLERPGLQDITTHVDFGNLRRHALRRGFVAAGICSLRVFLIGLGVASDDAVSIASQLALRHLLVSEIAESHRVQLLLRGVDPDALSFGRARLERPAASTNSAC